jgi:hypothetical protein
MGGGLSVGLAYYVQWKITKDRLGSLHCRAESRSTWSSRQAQRCGLSGRTSPC